MARTIKVVAAALMVNLAACTSIWAQMISSKVTDDIMRLESYRGTIVETRLDPNDPEVEVVRELLYQKPWKIRAVTTAPEAHKGETFIYDGQQVIMWWPGELFGIRITGIDVPSESAIRDHIEREAYNALRAYAYSLDGEYPIAGQRALKWRVIPTDEDAPYRTVHNVWGHQGYTIPLRVDLFDKKGDPWYGMAFKEITFDVEVPQDAFAFEFPRNAVVFEWNLRDEGISMEEAKETMNFEVMAPTKLPDGHKIRKIVPSHHCLPVIAVMMDDGATWISLTESRSLGDAYEIPLGKKVTLPSGHEAVLNFMGTYATLSWAQGRTQLTLIGNVAYPELIEIAGSIEPVK